MLDKHAIAQKICLILPSILLKQVPAVNTSIVWIYPFYRYISLRQEKEEKRNILPELKDWLAKKTEDRNLLKPGVGDSTNIVKIHNKEPLDTTEKTRPQVSQKRLQEK